MKSTIMVIVTLIFNGSLAFGAFQQADYTCGSKGDAVDVSINKDGIVFDGESIKFNSADDINWKTADEENFRKLYKHKSSIHLLINFDSSADLSSLGIFSFIMKKGVLTKIVSQSISTDLNESPEKDTISCKKK